MRNVERGRTKQLPEIRALENPEQDFDIEQYLGDVTEDEYMSNPEGYRDVCWDLKVRNLIIVL